MNHKTYKRAGFGTVTPYLLIPDAHHLIELIEQVFDGEMESRFTGDKNRIMHVEARIGDSRIMFGEPPETFDLAPGSIYLYVPDCDDTFNKAIQFGCAEIMPVASMEHSGQRYGGVKDRNGTIWWIATQIEDVSDDEEQKRIEAAGL
ncbi:MAG: VOC family protein [Flavobacteriales bacterium]|nr:VOC family protein [Bacteroidota bacterium]MCB9241401.1 VOC family protein [Flavobacteriales bacterium]